MGLKISKQKPREIYLYHRADWDPIKEDLTDLLHTLAQQTMKTVDELYYFTRYEITHTTQNKMLFTVAYF